MTGSLRTVLLGALAASLLSAAPLEAQQRGRQGRRGQGPNRMQLEQQYRARTGQMMQRRLGLGEEQAVSLSRVVQDFEVQRRELRMLEQATRRRVEALVLEGGDNEEEALDLLQRMSELHVREADLFRAEQEALLEVLTPLQVLQLQSLRLDLGRRIGALGGGRRGDPGLGRRRGGRGGGNGGLDSIPPGQLPSELLQER